MDLISNQPYQLRDLDIVDYKLYPLKDKVRDKVFILRGPKPPKLETNSYFSCLGAAYTFGCYTPKPYPLLLAQKLELPCLNLGIAGAGATLYIQQENSLLIELANQSRFVIVLVMSGRSHPSSICMPPKVGSLTAPAIGKQYNKLFNEDKSAFEKIVREMRSNFVEHYISLANKLTIPKILLYFSTRKPNYEDNFNKNYKTANMGFPHFINKSTIKKIIPYFNDYVECISAKNFPQKLINRWTDEPINESEGQPYNKYYASPQMHKDAQKILLPVCQKYL